METFYDWLVGSAFQFTLILLYFYNLLNLKGRPLKNLAPKVHTRTRRSCAMHPSKENLPSFLLISLLLLHSARYFRHLIFLLLYCFLIFAFFYSTNAPSCAKKILNFVLMVTALIVLALTLRWFFGLSFFGKFYLSFHDGVCLMWCLTLTPFSLIDYPIFASLVLDRFALSVLWELFFSLYTLIVFLYHTFYFARPYSDSRLRKKASQ